MLAASRSAASSRPLGEILDDIAAQATKLTAASSASLVEFDGDQMHIAGSYGLSDEYRERISNWPTPVNPSRAPAGLAARGRVPVLSRDATVDPRLADVAEMFASEGLRAVAAAPLVAGSAVLGTLAVYRKTAYDWTASEVQLLVFFAQHAATAVRTARLLVEQRHHVEALERLVVRLREQTHEHANRLHAIAGLLSLGEAEEAAAFVEDLGAHHVADRAIFESQPSDNALAGLLWVESVLARQRSIRLELDVAGDISALPTTDAQALTIVGNLLDNALDAVDAVSAPRRRVRLSIRVEENRAGIAVRDWGTGIGTVASAFEPGFSTKEAHSGVGLVLVREAVRAVHGRLSVERHPDGTCFHVELPISRERREAARRRATSAAADQAG